MKTAQSINWDLESIYPGGVQSKKLEDQLDDLSKKIPQLHKELESEHEVNELADIIQQIQEASSYALQIDEYCICLSSDDIKDTSAMVLMDRSNHLQSQIKQLILELEDQLNALSDPAWKRLLSLETMVPVRHYLMRLKEKAEDRLPKEVESAINRLSLNGFSGWEDHYEQWISQVEVEVNLEEGPQRLNANEAMIQAMLSNDRSVRKITSEAIEETCRKHESNVASMINHLAGYRLELYSMRGWSLRKELCDKNKITEHSLNSMMNALQNHKPYTQRFLERKARLLGIEQLSYYDMHTPVFHQQTKVTYDEAKKIIVEQFHTFSQDMGEFAEKAFEDGWIDAEPRKNKRFGAFCAAMPVEDESRILMSFEGNYQDVVTLAHELGHAYHNSILQKEPAFSQEQGTSLAETASTFTENLVLDAAIERAGTEEEKLSLLEMKITNAVKYTTLIPSMFDFELKFYESRMDAKISPEELCNLCKSSEQKWTNESLEGYDHYKWMTVPHLFDTQEPFYNIPYTIGYLFSNSLYSLSKHKEAFPDLYREVLRKTGVLSIDQLGEEILQYDLSNPDFWNESLSPLEEAIDLFLFKTNEYA
ncbi:M3 family oligoendopeptidase [Halobacillus yeomjeoni]|uniref:M3 family oligoendopeptidase n=1 Tax=Halobacillus yeomjeoni TaxID=311194 RepID=A0A931HU28_9BACI|nr:M3 family oligoendopeptidase [Halobacillus yeomjeoni]MBH0229226.1 M3 family oligoendopeptidase [Halobacillus yeomjeoni]